MTRVIDKDEAIALVKKYADENPDNMVPCQYVLEPQVTDGDYETCCIVGQILVHDLDFDIEKLSHVDGRFHIAFGEISEAISRNDFMMNFGGAGVSFTPEAIKVLDAAQSVQDERPWDAYALIGENWFKNADWPGKGLELYGSTWSEAYRFVKEHFATETTPQDN